MGELQSLLSSLEEHSGKIVSCTDCSLYKTRNVAFPGIINPYSPIVFLVDCPTMKDDQEGKLFSGKFKSENLEKCLRKASLELLSASFIPVIKCFSDQEAKNNGVQLRESLASCSRHLIKQLSILKPKVVISIGNISQSMLYTPLLLWGIEIPKGYAAGRFKNNHFSLQKSRGRLYVANSFWNNRVLLSSTWDVNSLTNFYSKKAYKTQLLKDFSLVGNGIRNFLYLYDNPKLRLERSLDLSKLRRVDTNSPIEIYDATPVIGKRFPYNKRYFSLYYRMPKEDLEKYDFAKRTDSQISWTTTTIGRKLTPKQIRHLCKSRRVHILRKKRDKLRNNQAAPTGTDL